jgi:hypothetical protein
MGKQEVIRRQSNENGDGLESETVDFLLRDGDAAYSYTRLLMPFTDWNTAEMME